AGAGIPPTILQFHEFWEPLQSKVAAWIFDTFGIETKAVPDARRVVPGNIASNQLDSLLAFGFNAKFSPGLCAIAIDEAGAAMNAAQRLQQGADSLEGVSPLFQKLLFETPAFALWRLIASGFSDHTVLGSHAPLSELSQAAGGFEPTHRYLMVGFTCTLDGKQARFWVIFDLDYVQRRAIEFEQQAARQRHAASSQGRGALRESVKSSMITIEGVLDRIPMTIGECSRLEIGQIIVLPDVDTARVSLQAETVNGTVDIGHCEMGVWKRQRALKLKTPILEPFARELAKL
ncbi:MAG: FliM/FliN family flagellar motor C-terminal domain-containing protein, partial [Hyphomonas sp.]|nr:FliM/FliN family flagellar motor C-terminal domain-containing protein [Hyphomonas sp.]